MRFEVRIRLEIFEPRDSCVVFALSLGQSTEYTRISACVYEEIKIANGTTASNTLACRELKLRNPGWLRASSAAVKLGGS